MKQQNQMNTLKLAAIQSFRFLALSLSVLYVSMFPYKSCQASTGKEKAAAQMSTHLQAHMETSEDGEHIASSHPVHKNPMLDQLLEASPQQQSFINQLKARTHATHEKVHDTAILRAIHGQTASHVLSHNFHAGLLTLYSAMEEYLSGITHQETQDLLKELSRVSALTIDCANMSVHSVRQADDFFRGLASMQAYIEHLQTIRDEPAKLLIHFYVHLGGILAGGQKGKQFLLRIHQPNELTHYDFANLTGGPQAALTELRAVVNDAPVNFLTLPTPLIEEAEKAFQLSLNLYTELHIPE